MESSFFCAFFAEAEIQSLRPALIGVAFTMKAGDSKMKLEWNTEHPDQTVLLIDRDQLNTQYPQLLERTQLLKDHQPIILNKVMLEGGELSGTFVVPQKEHPILDRTTFGFILEDKTVYFVLDAQDRGSFTALLDAFEHKYDLIITSPYVFLLRFINYLVEEDVYFLDEYNEKLEDIEEGMFGSSNSGVEHFIMMTRRDMSVLENYYLQMLAVSENLQEAIIIQNAPEENALLDLFSTRCTQLLQLVGSIKDSTDQIWNLRQTQLSDKQNKITTLLTIITALFLPLSFLTGWYGMNFVGMPLVHFKYGYLIIICVVIVIVTCELIWIKKEHWLSASQAFETDSEHKKKKARLAKEIDKLNNHHDAS